MYEAIVALKEGADLAEYAASKLNPGEHDRLLREAKQLREQAASVRKLIEERGTRSLDYALTKGSPGVSGSTQR